jgi:hypothetical protein
LGCFYLSHRLFRQKAFHLGALNARTNQRGDTRIVLRQINLRELIFGSFDGSRKGHGFVADQWQLGRGYTSGGQRLRGDSSHRGPANAFCNLGGKTASARWQPFAQRGSCFDSTHRRPKA